MRLIWYQNWYTGYMSSWSLPCYLDVLIPLPHFQTQETRLWAANRVCAIPAFFIEDIAACIQCIHLLLTLLLGIRIPGQAFWVGYQCE